jgi:hypothetical protein
MTKYLARLDGQIVGTRSTDRTYTHAIVVNGHARTNFVAAWSGRLDLALKTAAKWGRYGYRVDIVPAEVVTPKKATPANIETALLDRFPSLKGKLTVI